jgi:long-chain acyl-CoA synthetase
VAVIGEGRKYVSALVVPAFEPLERWAKGEGIPFASRADLVSEPRVLDHYRRRIEARSHDLAPFERIVRFTLLPESFTVEGGDITPTMKVRRRAAAEKHGAEVEAMYP